MDLDRGKLMRDSQRRLLSCRAFEPILIIFTVSSVNSSLSLIVFLVLFSLYALNLSWLNVSLLTDQTTLKTPRIESAENLGGPSIPA